MYAISLVGMWFIDVIWLALWAHRIDAGKVLWVCLESRKREGTPTEKSNHPQRGREAPLLTPHSHPSPPLPFPDTGSVVLPQPGARHGGDPAPAQQVHHGAAVPPRHGVLALHPATRADLAVVGRLYEVRVQLGSANP